MYDKMPYEVHYRESMSAPFRVLAQALTRENAVNYQRAYQRVQTLQGKRGFIYIFKVEM